MVKLISNDLEQSAMLYLARDERTFLSVVSSPLSCIQDEATRKAYDEAVKAIETKLFQRSQKNHFLYVAEWKSGRLEHKFDHLACFVG